MKTGVSENKTEKSRNSISMGEIQKVRVMIAVSTRVTKSERQYQQKQATRKAKA